MKITREQSKILKIFYVILAVLNICFVAFLPNVFGDAYGSNFSFLSEAGAICLIIIIACYVAGIVFILNYKESFALIFSGGALALFVVGCILAFATVSYGGDNHETLGVGAFVILLFGIATVALNYILAKNPYEKEPKRVIVEQSKNDDSLDQIRELKKLLDEGIINEEEFDAKKKQLLGL